MARPRRDPFPGFQFVVEIDGVTTAAFKEVSGLDGSVDVIEYREGADVSPTTRKIPGLVRYANVVLSRGLTDSRDLYDWWNAIVSGKADRRAASIVLLDAEQNPVRRWKLRAAWPARYAVSTLDAATSGVVIETLELAHEGFELE
ncbi:MAG: phage tail protein [Gaiellaceae bacterium]